MTRSFQNFAALLFLFFMFPALVYGTSPKDGLHPAHGGPKDNKHQLLNGDWALSAINLNEKTKKYHQFINRAARAIYANDFLVASSYYDSAFLFKNDPYYNDITNSILVNHKVGCSEKNNANIKMLFELKRIDTAFLFSQLPKRVFNDKNLAYINALSKKYATTKPKVHPLDAPLRAMFIADQKAHGFEGFNMSDPVEATEAFDTRAGIDHENLLHFHKLYKQFGFPTETKTGIKYDKDRDWPEIITVLLLHFAASKDVDDVKLALSIMEPELEKGNLHPAIYAKVCDYIHSETKKAEYNFMQTTLCKVKDVFYRPFVFYTDSLMKEVNSNRISIGLDSFHVAQRQAVCQHIGSKNLNNQPMVILSHHIAIDVLDYGFVKYAFDDAKMDMDTYRIRTDKILKECICQEKTY